MDKRTDVLDVAQRRKNMRAISSKDTAIEIELAKALWNRGYRYRKNDKRLIGKPDITFFKYKIAVFVDGEFFHGQNWEVATYKIKGNRDFWWTKIETNIQRDKIVNSQLQDEGWTVLRFWGRQIKKDLNGCIFQIEKAIKMKSPSMD